MAKEIEVEVLDDLWYLNIANKVMNTIGANLNADAWLKDYLGVEDDIQIVSNVAPDTLAKFPTVFYTELNPTELGQSLDNTDISAVRVTIEVRAYVNTGSDEDCMYLLQPVIEGLKEFRFNITQLPIYTKTNNVVQGVIRANRVVGSEEKELTYVTIKEMVEDDNDGPNS